MGGRDRERRGEGDREIGRGKRNRKRNREGVRDKGRVGNRTGCGRQKEKTRKEEGREVKEQGKHGWKYILIQADIHGQTYTGSDNLEVAVINWPVINCDTLQLQLLKTDVV